MKQTKALGFKWLSIIFHFLNSYLLVSQTDVQTGLLQSGWPITEISVSVQQNKSHQVVLFGPIHFTFAFC